MTPLGTQLKTTAAKAVAAFAPKDTDIQIIVYPDISANVSIAWVVSVELRLPCGSFLECEVLLTHKPFYNMLEVAQFVGKAVHTHIEKFQNDRMI